MSADIRDLIRQAECLASPPQVALEVLRLTKSSDSSVDDLIQVIQNDAALTARMLSVVNSSLYGMPRKIASIKQAVVALGLRTVKVMALSFSLVDAVRSDGTADEAFDYPRYWRRSLSTAVAARLLARVIAPPLAEEAFVAGLLSDLGMVAAWRCAPELYEPVLKASKRQQRPQTEIELEMLGVTHAELSRTLLDQWGLPEGLCQVVGGHHGEDVTLPDANSRQIVGLVRAGARIASVVCADRAPEEMERVRETCIKELGIDAVELETVLIRLDATVQETASMLAVQVADGVAYAHFASEAAAQLAQLNMEAEHERTETSRREAAANKRVGRLEREKKQALEAAATDSLTRIPNRAAFDEQIEQELKRARQRGHSLGLIMLDVDHFKRVNDEHGHPAGDEVLRQIGLCLRRATERIAFAARYGGEEFAVILARETAEQVRALAEEIRRSIENKTIEHDGRQLRVTASFGAACVNPQEDRVSSGALIKEADRRLYRAKRHGRNRVEMKPERGERGSGGLLSRVRRIFKNESGPNDVSRGR